MFVDTKTLRFWEANFTKGDIAEIAFKSEISHKKIKEARYVRMLGVASALPITTI